MQEQSGHSWDTGLRLAKTSEDRYVRPNSSSSSSRSSTDEPIASPRSNVFHSSTTTTHQSNNKSDYNKVLISCHLGMIIQLLFRFYIHLLKLNR